jgi:hypothetical protein
VFDLHAGVQMPDEHASPAAQLLPAALIERNRVHPRHHAELLARRAAQGTIKAVGLALYRRAAAFSAMMHGP